MQMNLSFIQHIVLLLVLSTAVFFPYAQNLGMKWQLALVACLPILIFRTKKLKINQQDVFILGISLYSLLIAIFSQLPIHINLFIGFLISFLISKVEINESWVVKISLFSMIVNHMMNNILPSYDYLEQFNKLNLEYGVNRSAFIFFCLYFYFLIQNDKFRFLAAFLTLLHTSRFMMIGILSIEFLLKNRLKVKIIILLSILFSIFIVIEPWIIWHYIIGIGDLSSSDRLNRYVYYLKSVLDNFLIPSVHYDAALHNIFLEIFMYLGMPALFLYALLLITSKNLGLLFFFSIGLLSPKTVHDLLMFYVLIGWIMKYNTKNIINVRFR